ncbi:MAG TPA: hypothetical protein VNL96_04245, partial [Gemmatimonadaceae bacterium]|nr:hypothetical protein [Gemmatimonadaceae bacterium]
MLDWLIALAAGTLAAILAYGWRPAYWPLAVSRALVAVLAVALFLDAPLGARSAPAIVALDVSQSWMRGGDTTAFAQARQLAAQRSDRILLFGDSVREVAGARVPLPSDRRSLLAPLVARAAADGRPLLVISDGEADDPEVLSSLPLGSRVVVQDRRPVVDLAVSNLRVPRIAVSGDTARITVDLSAGPLEVPGGALRIDVDQRPATSLGLDAMPPFGERSIDLQVRLPPTAGWIQLRAVVQVAGDLEPRNDTLVATLRLTSAARALLVSTNPDLDVRELGTVLRGIVSLPSRGYLRVATGQWREEGTLAPVAEEAVRSAIRTASLLVIHGDTAFFGPPRTLGAGGLLLVVSPGVESGEWFATGTLASPLAAPLAGLEWDSLPPLQVGAAAGGASFALLEVRRGRRLERAAVGFGWEQPRRVVVVNASGFWRWRMRGGAGAAAHAAFWGAILDWLAAEDRPVGVAPLASVYRDGDRIAWIRGRGVDSTLKAVILSYEER